MSFAAFFFLQQRFICLSDISKEEMYPDTIYFRDSVYFSNKDNHAQNRAKAFSADFRELWHLKWQYNLQTLPLTVIPSLSA